MVDFKVSSMELKVLLVLAFTCLVLLTTSVEGGCIENKFCCPGKNVTCKARGARLNDIKYPYSKYGKSSHVCFCDEYCLGIGDCCSDYHKACKPQDCILGGWESWSSCSVQCGRGQKKRNRRILQEPRNGGKDCGIYEEMKSCHGTKCIRPRHLYSSHQHRETAKIIPAQYGSWRKSKLYDPFNDIRKNLFNHYSANAVIKRPAYCAHFEVTHTKGSCNLKSYQGWTQILQKGQTVCVECQPLAMKKKLGVRCSGDGVFKQETRWNAITIGGCHGKWKLMTNQNDCTCDPNHEMSFILL